MKLPPKPSWRFINVPYAEKDAAKALGAQWHPEAKRWHIPPGLKRRTFKQWPDAPVSDHELRRLVALADPERAAMERANKQIRHRAIVAQKTSASGRLLDEGATRLQYLLEKD